LGSETSRTWRKERQEASHRGHREKAGGAVASPVGERGGIPTVVQRHPNHRGRSRIKTNGKTKIKIVPGREKTKAQSRVPVTALIAWPAFHSSVKREGAKQIAAPAEPRTPNMHRANQSLLESADGSMATVATRREKTFLCDKQPNSL
jgi:hypothetical protein